jgi:LytS/YehU family sensor histidine kinase
VENAIRHGVSPNAGTGRIDVRSRRDGDWLTLEIRDNGAGLVEGRVRPDGIGLTTTKARLERLYGDRQELTLANLPEGGCVARIRIPFQLTGDERADIAMELLRSATEGTPLAAAGD